MKKIIGIVVSLWSGVAFPCTGMGLRLASVEVAQYRGEVHDSYLDPIDADLIRAAEFRTKFDFLRCGSFSLFSDNYLHFDQAKTGLIKHAGWRYEMGMEKKFSNKSAITVGLKHHSRHVFEEERSEHFPLYDAYFIRLTLYEID